MRGEKAPCSSCGREVGIYVPKGGDGSLWLARIHNNAEGMICAGSRREVAA